MMIHSCLILHTSPQPGPLEPLTNFQYKGILFEGLGTLFVHENNSINEHMFDRDLPDKWGTSSNILLVSEAMVVKGLPKISEHIEVSLIIGTRITSLSPHPY